MAMSIMDGEESGGWFNAARDARVQRNVMTTLPVQPTV
jgi:hypothetical protein